MFFGGIFPPVDVWQDEVLLCVFPILCIFHNITYAPNNAEKNLILYIHRKIPPHSSPPTSSRHKSSQTSRFSLPSKILPRNSSLVSSKTKSRVF